MLPDHKFFERIDRCGGELMDIPAARILTKPLASIIYRPLGGDEERHTKLPSFFLISFNGCFYRLLLDPTSDKPIKVSNRGFNRSVFDPVLLGEDDTVSVICKLKNYLVENMTDIVSDYSANTHMSRVEFYSRACYKLMEFIICRLMVNQSNHRIRFIDMSNK